MSKRGSDWISRCIGISVVIVLLAVMVSPCDARTESSQKQERHLPLPREFQPGVSHIPAIAARFSPDGKTLIVLSRKHSDVHDYLSYIRSDHLSDAMCAWDVHTGKQVWRVDDITVSRVKFSADGKTIACLESTEVTSKSDKWVVRLRDVQTGRPLSQPAIPIDASSSAFALSPDGKILAVFQEGLNLCLLDTITGKPTMTCDKINTHRFYSSWDLTFSPDGYNIAARPYIDTPNYNLDNPELIVWTTLGGGGEFIYLHLNRVGGWTNLSDDSLESILPPVTLDPAFFTSNRRLVCSDSMLQISGGTFTDSQLQPMIPESEMWTGDGYRLFVGFIDQAESTKDHEPHLTLFYTKIEKPTDPRDVRQLELWDLWGRKRIKVIPEPKGYSKNSYFRVLDYSPAARLVARCDLAGILTLQQL